MPGPNLPTDLDTTYSDNATDPSVKLHQQYHDMLHALLNRFDIDLLPVDGDMLYGVSGLWTRAVLDDKTNNRIVQAVQGDNATIVVNPSSDGDSVIISSPNSPALGTIYGGNAASLAGA